MLAGLVHLLAAAVARSGEAPGLANTLMAALRLLQTIAASAAGRMHLIQADMGAALQKCVDFKGLQLAEAAKLAGEVLALLATGEKV